EIVAVRKLNRLLDDQFDYNKNSAYKEIHRAVQVSRDTNYHDNSIIFMLWLIVSNMKDLFPDEGQINKQNYVDLLLLDSPVKRILRKLGRGDYETYHEINLLNIFQNNFDEMLEIFDQKEKGQIVSEPTDRLIEKKKDGLLSLLDNDLVRNYLGVNQHEDIWYYSKENFEDLIDWIFTFAGLKLMNCESGEEKTLEECLEEKTKLFKTYQEKLKEILTTSHKAEYKLEELKEKLTDIK
ncbi:MAG: hypothetical protein ACYC5G_04880, partial [Candidatus Doudnabacteria bacterium]